MFCKALTLDLMDAANEHQNNIEKDIIKTRLDEHGVNIGLFQGSASIFTDDVSI